jgi:Na+-driven multidrug efflux pump
LPFFPFLPHPLFLSFLLQQICNRYTNNSSSRQGFGVFGSGVQAPFFQVINGSGKIQTTFLSSCSSFLTKLLLLLLLFVAQLLHPDESLMYNRHGFLASSSSFLSQDLKWVSLLLDHCGQGWYCTCMYLASQLLDDSFLLFVRCCCLFDLTYYHFGSVNFLSLVG